MIRAATARLALLGLFTTALVGAADPASASGLAKPGPVVSSLPAQFSGDAQATGRDDSTAGPAALNTAVANSCNAGHALVGPRWWTLPSSAPVAGPQDVYAVGQTDALQGAAPAPDHLPAHVAFVNYASGQVVACNGDARPLTPATPLALVMWFDPSFQDCVATLNQCSPDPYSLTIGLSPGAAPGNDDSSHPRTVSSLPYADTGDTTAASDTGDGDLSAALPVCPGEIEPVDTHAVWYRVTPTRSGNLPVTVSTQRYPGTDVPLGYLTAEVFEQTASGLTPVDPYCEDSNPVLAGHTYDVVVGQKYDAYFESPTVLGAPYSLRIGPVGTDAMSLSVQDNRNGSVTLNAATDGNGAAATSYAVTRDGTDRSGAGPQTITVIPVADPWGGRRAAVTFSNLILGRAYTFTAAAVNPKGTGPAASLTHTVFATSSPTTKVTSVSAASRSATIGWTAPSTLNGLTVTGYRVSRTGSDTAGSGVYSSTVSASARSFTFTHLLAGPLYDLSVAAITSAGTSDDSTVSTAVGGPLGRVHDQSVESGPAWTPGSTGTTATVHWTPPVAHGRPAVSGYRISRDGTDSVGSGGYTTSAVPAGATSFTFRRLSYNETYHFTITPLNSAGGGDPLVVEWIDDAPTPGQPSTVGAVRGSTSATVSWQSPAGSSVTSYRIRRFAAATNTVQATSSASAGARSFAATGLTNGVSYSFDVTAVNSSGLGAPSARTAVVVPATVPGAPTSGAASSGAAGGVITATARWTAPASTGGSAVTGYVVTALRMSSTGSVLATTVSGALAPTFRSCAMALPQGGAYRFTVHAVNALGKGAASGRSNQVTAR